MSITIKKTQKETTKNQNLKQTHEGANKQIKQKKPSKIRIKKCQEKNQKQYTLNHKFVQSTIENKLKNKTKQNIESGYKQTYTIK